MRPCYRAGSITLQLVRPDIRQSCILLAAVRSRASQSPIARTAIAITRPTIAPRRLSPCSGSVIGTAMRGRRARHAGRPASKRLPKPWAFRSTPSSRVQVTRTTTRWHCHSLPRIPLETGFGATAVIESKAVPPTTSAATARSANLFLVDHGPIIAATPVRSGSIGPLRALFCERNHHLAVVRAISTPPIGPCRNRDVDVFAPDGRRRWIMGGISTRSAVHRCPVADASCDGTARRKSTDQLTDHDREVTRPAQ